MGPQAINALMDGLTTIALGWFLVWYEVNRKWNKDDLSKAKKITWWWPMFTGIVRYRVAIIIGAVLIPQWADWLPKLFEVTK